MVSLVSAERRGQPSTVDTFGDAPGAMTRMMGWQRLTLRVNFSWTLAGTLVYSACQWLLLAALAKLRSAEVVGEFAFALAVSGPIMTFSMLHLRALLATDTRSDYTFGDFLVLRLTTTVLGWAGICALGCLGGYTGYSAWLIVAAATVGAADALSDICHGAFQQRERLDRLGWAFLMKGPLGLAAVALTAAVGGGALWALVFLAVSRWLVLAAYEVPTTARLLDHRNVGLLPRPQCDFRGLARLALTALPLGLVMLLLSLQANVPRYLLEHYSGLQTLGIFAGLVALSQAGALVVNALGQAASPRLAHYHATGQGRAFRALSVKLVVLGGLLGIAGVALTLVAGPEILSLVYGPEYAAEADVFVLLMMAAAASYAASPLGYAATASRRIRLQPVIQIVNLAITAGVGWWCAAAGTRGMAYALLASAITSLVLFAGLLTLPGHAGPGPRPAGSGGG
jgi:O-antigen/teichoic acid export membrane protein